MQRIFKPSVVYWMLSLAVISHFLMIWMERYSNEYVPGVLLLISILWLLAVSFRTPLSRAERALYIVSSLLPISTLVRLFFDLSYSPSAFDIQSRLVFAIPIMILLVRYGFDRRLFIAGLIVAAVLACYIVVSLTLEGQVRPKLNMNQITSANFMAYLGFAVLSFMVTVVFVGGASRWWLLLGIVVLLVALVAVLFSKSRGAWLSLPFFVVATLWLFRQFLARWQLVALVMTSIIGGLVMVYTPGSPVLPRIEQGLNDVNRYFSTGEVRGSIDTRLNMWETSIVAFKLNPVFGLGEKGLQKFEREGGVAKYLEKYGHQHSDFFDIIAKRGLVGLSFYFSFWFIFFWVFNKFTSPGYRESGILLGLGYLVFGLTETTTGNYAAMSLLATQTAFLFGAGHREWLLLNQPELLERFSTYWPVRSVMLSEEKTGSSSP